jgi:hypothetical protein
MSRLVFGSFVLNVKKTCVKDSKTSSGLRYTKELKISEFNAGVNAVTECAWKI